jgi:MFS family permease
MHRGQSCSVSAMEALSSTVTGFVLAVLLQRVLFPALGHDLALSENLLVSAAFTILSFVRQYLIRRLFDRYARR